VLTKEEITNAKITEDEVEAMQAPLKELNIQGIHLARQGRDKLDAYHYGIKDEAKKLKEKELARSKPVD